MSTQARVRTQEMRRTQQVAALRQAKRRRVVTVVGILVILGLVAAIVLAVVKAAGGDNSSAPATGEVIAPKNLTPNDSIPVGEASAPVTVQIYYDYMCPACGSFEAANGGELDRLLDEGVVRIELRPISFLDRTSNGTEFSTRSANAMATVADAAPKSAWDFHTALYGRQPAEGSDGLSDDQIADIATGAGVPADVVDRFTDETYRPWTASVTQEAFDSGIQGTPTVKIDGTEFKGDIYTAGSLTEAIESAAADQ
jgi:protein-disulfide isomerase